MDRSLSLKTLLSAASLIVLLLYACDSAPSETQAVIDTDPRSDTATLAVDIVVLTPTPTPKIEPRLMPIAEGEFVTRQGAQLRLAGQPFRFVGSNAYFLQPEMVYGNVQGVTETLDEMVKQGMSVVRIWAFNDSDPVGDPASVQPEPGVYREESLVALDQVIAEAKKRNVRLILTLVNYFRDYGGVPRYVEWCACDAKTRDFYTNERIKDWYRDYVSMLVNRTNTVTGIAYRDEPAILAWELGNELRNPGQSSNALLTWHTEMAAHIKSLDPNHLVADGGEGFDDAAQLYDLSNTYAVRGDEGASFHRLANVPEIDMLSIHLYPDHWGLNNDSDVKNWLEVHAKLARQAGKPIYLGEYGVIGDDTARAAIFDRWLSQALVDDQLTGALAWGLTYEKRPDYDGLSIYCSKHIETCAILRQYAIILLNTTEE